MRPMSLMSAPIFVSQSIDDEELRARISTSSGLARFLPPLNVSSYMIFTVSLIARFFWNTVSAAFMPPAASCVLPPVIGIFSSTTTFAFSSKAVIAAVSPGPAGADDDHAGALVARGGERLRAGEHRDASELEDVASFHDDVSCHLPGAGVAALAAGGGPWPPLPESA